MKDKLKGLILGLAIGTLMTGSVAYAAGGASKINVYFRELKFVFDGVEKNPDKQSAFIYNGSTYVPIRFVSETLGKEVQFDNDTGTIWIGKNYGGEGLVTVAAYKGGQVTRVEFETFLAASAFLTQQGGPSTDDAYRQTMVKQLIGLKLMEAKANKAASDEAAKTAEMQLGQIRQYFGSAAALEAQLKQRNLTVWDIKQFISRSIVVQKVLVQSIDEAALKAEYDRQRKADSGAFVTASVRHILIATSDSSTGNALRTEDEALARAKEVRDKLANGGDFAELAKTYSDDPGSKNNGGLYENADISGYVPEFKKAVAELPLNQLSELVKTAYGYHIIKVESRNVKTFDQAKPQLLQPLTSQAFQSFLTKDVPGLIEKIDLPKAK